MFRVYTPWQNGTFTGSRCGLPCAVLHLVEAAQQPVQPLHTPSGGPCLITQGARGGVGLLWDVEHVRRAGPGVLARPQHAPVCQRPQASQDADLHTPTAPRCEAGGKPALLWPAPAQQLKP